MPQEWRGTPMKKRVTIDGKIFTLNSEHMHKSIADKKASGLRKKGWNVRVIERWSTYSGLEIFSVYKRRK